MSLLGSLRSWNAKLTDAWAVLSKQEGSRGGVYSDITGVRGDGTGELRHWLMAGTVQRRHTGPRSAKVRRGRRQGVSSQVGGGGFAAMRAAADVQAPKKRQPMPAHARLAVPRQVYNNVGTMVYGCNDGKMYRLQL